MSLIEESRVAYSALQHVEQIVDDIIDSIPQEVLFQVSSNSDQSIVGLSNVMCILAQCILSLVPGDSTDVTSFNRDQNNLFVHAQDFMNKKIRTSGSEKRLPLIRLTPRMLLPCPVKHRLIKYNRTIERFLIKDDHTENTLKPIVQTGKSKKNRPKKKKADCAVGEVDGAICISEQSTLIYYDHCDEDSNELLLDAQKDHLLLPKDTNCDLCLDAKHDNLGLTNGASTRSILDAHPSHRLLAAPLPSDNFVDHHINLVSSVTPNSNDECNISPFEPHEYKDNVGDCDDEWVKVSRSRKLRVQSSGPHLSVQTARKTVLKACLQPSWANKCSGVPQNSNISSVDKVIDVEKSKNDLTVSLPEEILTVKLTNATTQDIAPTTSSYRSQQGARSRMGPLSPDWIIPETIFRPPTTRKAVQSMRSSTEIQKSIEISQTPDEIGPGSLMDTLPTNGKDFGSLAIQILPNACHDISDGKVYPQSVYLPTISQEWVHSWDSIKTEELEKNLSKLLATSNLPRPLVAKLTTLFCTHQQSIPGLPHTSPLTTSSPTQLLWDDKMRAVSIAALVETCVAYEKELQEVRESHEMALQSTNMRLYIAQTSLENLQDEIASEKLSSDV